jgi:hypothetical protein
MSHRLTLRIRRTQGWADFTVTVPDNAYLLDAWRADTKTRPCHFGMPSRPGAWSARTGANGHASHGADVARPKWALEPIRNFPLLAICWRISSRCWPGLTLWTYHPYVRQSQKRKASRNPYVLRIASSVDYV